MKNFWLDQDKKEERPYSAFYTWDFDDTKISSVYVSVYTTGSSATLNIGHTTYTS